MPKLKSSRKRLRINQKAHVRNMSMRSAMRTAMKKVRTNTDATAAQQLLRSAVSTIDKTAKKGGIRRGTADRYKSRLSRFVAKLA